MPDGGHKQHAVRHGARRHLRSARQRNPMVTLKATYDFFNGGTQLASEQRPVVQADDYLGDELTTSIRVTTDFLPPRPSYQRHPVRGGRQHPGARQIYAGGGAGWGPELPCHCNGGSDRIWTAQQSAAFETMPLIWENSYGGFDNSHSNPAKHDALQDNPIARAFWPRRQSWTPMRCRCPI